MGKLEMEMEMEMEMEKEMVDEDRRRRRRRRREIMKISRGIKWRRKKKKKGKKKNESYCWASGEVICECPSHTLSGVDCCKPFGHQVVDFSPPGLHRGVSFHGGSIFPLFRKGQFP